MISKTFSSVLVGVDAVTVEVETQVTGGLRRFTIVGLPDGILKESKDRIRCAIENADLQFPKHEVIVCLGPAALPKTGSGFDLPIALSILAADGQIDPNRLRGYLSLGELSLDGQVKSVPGALSAACLARGTKRKLLLSAASAGVVRLAGEAEIVPVRTLAEAVRRVMGEEGEDAPITEPSPEFHVATADFSDVVGQHAAKRALEIVAAGGHNILMIGPPGTGKSMLAARLPSILPPLSGEELLQVVKIATSIPGTSSVAGGRISRARPFRAPHHSASLAGIVGGGSPVRPGELSLAHRGVLFLDELPEFRRDALESLRQPLESRKVVVSRAATRIELPADFILVAAMNPCPCGLLGSTARRCDCPRAAVRRYRARLSGPLLDRFDIHLSVPAISPGDLAKKPEHDPTPSMHRNVLAARRKQELRFKSTERLNVHLSVGETKKYCVLPENGARLLTRATERLGLSARSYFRIIRISRTIADLDGSEDIREQHVAEALAYRPSFE